MELCCDWLGRELVEGPYSGPWDSEDEEYITLGLLRLTLEDQQVEHCLCVTTLKLHLEILALFKTKSASKSTLIRVGHTSSNITITIR